MTKKHLCFITTTPLIIHFFLKDLLISLANDYHVTVICRKDSDFYLLAELEGRMRIKCVNITRSINIYYDLLALFQLCVIFLTHRFDIVHTVAPKAGLLGQLASYLTRVKTRIHTFQGEVWVNKKALFRYILKSADRLCALLASHVLVVSHSEKDFLVKERVLMSKKAFVLGRGSILGVDFDYHKKSIASSAKIRNDLGYSESDVVFLYLGRLNFDKGIDRLLECVNFVGPRFGEVRFLVVGRDEEQWEAEFDGFHFKQIIRYAGFDEDPRKYLQVADAILLPSRREGFGMVLLEAAAYKVPSLASKIYGIVDAVEDERSGLLFSNHDEMLDMIERMIGDKYLRIKMGEYAYNRAKSLFNREDLIGHYKRFYVWASERQTSPFQ